MSESPPPTPFPPPAPFPSRPGPFRASRGGHAGRRAVRGQLERRGRRPALAMTRTRLGPSGQWPGAGAARSGQSRRPQALPGAAGLTAAPGRGGLQTPSLRGPPTGSPAASQALPSHRIAGSTSQCQGRHRGSRVAGEPGTPAGRCCIPGRIPGPWDHRGVAAPAQSRLGVRRGPDGWERARALPSLRERRSDFTRARAGRGGRLDSESGSTAGTAVRVR
jgi:hypothetical protein